MTEPNIKKIPYGVSDFECIRTQDFYYVDKTRFIVEIENVGKYILLMRPRRFGKSLFVNTLSAYYDVNMADKYDDIFQGTDIYSQTTTEQGKYLVLKFNFSEVDPTPEKIDESFNQTVIAGIRKFCLKYAEFLPEGAFEEISSIKNSDWALKTLFLHIKRTDKRIYLIIDEYDNFANTLLSYDEAGYTKLTHGTGFFRLFFNIIKAATTDNDAAIARMFITGVTPLTLSDVTSGFNIGMNLSMDCRFNEIMGFNEEEVRKMIDYYREETKTFRHTTDEILNYIKPFYNNACFAPECVDDDHMFNSDMVLYFLNRYIATGSYPRDMIDRNVVSDMEKTRKMLGFGNKDGVKDQIIEKALNNGYIDCLIKESFRLEELADAESLASLMYYLGLLSYGRCKEGFVCPVITNQVMMEQYYTYMARYYQTHVQWQLNHSEINDLGRMAARQGDIIPLLSYLCQQMNEQSDNRDYNRHGESFVKGYLLALLGNENGYFVCNSESPLNHGYTDIMLSPKGDIRHAFLLELKYLKPSARKEEVDSFRLDAISQLKQYGESHQLKRQAEVYGWSLHRVAIVIRGWVLEYLEEI